MEPDITPEEHQEIKEILEDIETTMALLDSLGPRLKNAFMKAAWEQQYRLIVEQYATMMQQLKDEGIQR